MLKLERLKELLELDCATGVFRHTGVNQYREKGLIAGYDREGYYYITLDGEHHAAHKLVIYWITGVYPLGDVDHINMVRKDNTPTNLRTVTRSQNMTNTRCHADNPLQVKNVSLRKDTVKYAVRISINGKYKSIGSFDNLELAELVAIEARNKFHGEYARH